MPSSLGQAVPVLVLRQLSAGYAPYPHPYNIRSPWGEAEIWVAGQLRLGTHPHAIDYHIGRMTAFLNQGDGYAQDFLGASRRIIKNLARNGLFQELPSLDEYMKLIKGGNWPRKRVELSLMMCNRFEDHEMLRRYGMDAYTAHVLAKFPSLDLESRTVLEVEESDVIEEIITHRIMTEQRLRYYTEAPKAYPIGLDGENDIFDGPLRHINLFSSGPTGLNRGTGLLVFDESAVQQDLAGKKAMRDRTPSPSRRVRRAVDEHNVLRAGGSVEDLPERCELLAVLDEDMLI